MDWVLTLMWRDCRAFCTGALSRLSTCMICASLKSIEILCVAMDNITSWLFTTGCEALRVHPCGVYHPRESAILILGAHQGLGRSTALRFSELGYTVFALFPNETRQGAADSSDVSALIYIWHNRKERARQIPWGIMVPMSLDVWSASQRSRVHETIRTFCSDHDLHLVSLILCATPGGALCSADFLLAHSISLSKCEDIWRASFRATTEAIVMAEDYKSMLSEASGKIVVLSNCYQDHSQQFNAALEDIRLATIRRLATNLRPANIWVTTIVAGLYDSCHRKSGSQNSMMSASRAPSSSFVCSPLSFVSNEWVVSTIEKVVDARYPNYLYLVGIHARIWSLSTAMPIALSMVLRWLVDIAHYNQSEDHGNGA